MINIIKVDLNLVNMMFWGRFKMNDYVSWFVIIAAISTIIINVVVYFGNIDLDSKIKVHKSMCLVSGTLVILALINVFIP